MEESAIGCRQTWNTYQRPAMRLVVQMYRFLERGAVEETLTYITPAPTSITSVITADRINVRD